MEQRLLVAAQYGHDDEVRQLLAAGCSVHGLLDAVTFSYGRQTSSTISSNVMSIPERDQNVHLDTALHFACFSGHADVAATLLEAGAAAGHRNLQGFTPLHYAARRGHASVAELLLRFGADVDVSTSRRRQTPLHQAACAGHSAVVQILLAHSANSMATTSDGCTPAEEALSVSIDLATKPRRGKLRTDMAARVSSVVAVLRECERLARLLPSAQRLAWAIGLLSRRSPVFALSEDLLEAGITCLPQSQPTTVRRYQATF